MKKLISILMLSSLSFAQMIAPATSLDTREGGSGGHLITEF